jgi:hypothetical protein
MDLKNGATFSDTSKKRLVHHPGRVGCSQNNDAMTLRHVISFLFVFAKSFPSLYIIHAD